ncbi:MAG: hypothetical protein WCA59_17570 [Candidatus Binataceae bacterium]
MNVKKVLLIAAVALIGTVGVASANGHSCTDGRGNPHYCWQTDSDPTFSILTETATAQVGVNHIVTVQADCDGDETYAVGGGYTVMPKNAKIGYVVLAKVLNDGPVFSSTAANSSPDGWTVTVVNHGLQPANVTTYVTCIQPN